MMFLFVVALVVFVSTSLTLAAVVLSELFTTQKQRRIQHDIEVIRGVRTTYWNWKMALVVTLWVASGTIVFW